MKKAILCTLIFMIALSGVFAAPEGFHYGIESHVDYDLVLNDNTVPNKAVFVFNPYVLIDKVFEVKLRAEWKPLEDGNNGFDYMFNFDTEDFYTFTGSVLNYIETVKFHTGLFDFGIMRPDANDPLRIMSDEYDADKNRTYGFNYKAYARLDAAIVKAFVETTEFKATLGKGYRSLQHAGAEFNIGLVGVTAEVFHDGYFKGSMVVDEFKSHRFIGKVGLKMQTLVRFFELGNYITSDIVNATGAGEASYRLFDRWLLEVNGKLTAGPFTIDTTLFYNNKMPAYGVLPKDSQVFGVYSKALANFADFVDLKLYAIVPFTFDPFDFAKDSENVSYDKFGAELHVGNWWYAEGGLEINHLISDLDKGYEIKDMVQAGELWMKAGINTRNLDVYAKGTVLNLDGFRTKVTIGATFRADNFLAYPSK